MSTAKQQSRLDDLTERLRGHGRLIEQQVHEMDVKDRELLVARVIAVCAVAGQLIILWQWLVAPAIQALGCG
ncbi:hypothetical protein [Methylobacter sp.]|uniref:hypothetical protein n=1 Tax=Methylobacter sp. TaxID=2051955 RepID=UPI002489EBBC|nr:hypothetical protein [Methylobacter sp.]MDI1279262.1 hypothetical protein [Methylobacter sp.]